MEIPFGFCHCGCGEKTTITAKSCAKRGHIKGKPKKFISGHNSRFTPNDYTIEDRGYKTPCWIWLRAKTKSGYGKTMVGKVAIAAYALYYARAHNLPLDHLRDTNLEHDHLCRIRACINPDHISIVTKPINCRRRGTTKLTPEIAEQIRNSSLLGPELAKLFSVSTTTIYRIKERKIWN